MIPTALRSEWRKLVALRMTGVGALAIVAISLVVGVALAMVSDPGSIAAAQADSEYSVIFYSSAIATWGYAFLAASFVAVETNGIGQWTFVATPRRGRVLGAKLALIAGVGLLVGIAATAVTVAVTQGVLAVRGLETLDLTDAGLWRAMGLFQPLSLAVTGLLAAAVAVLTRSAVLAVVTIGAVTLIPVGAAQLLGDTYAATVPRWTPGAAVESIAGMSAPGSYGYLDPFTAIVCVALWVAVAAAAAFVVLPRLDIR
jgi:ABC-2 type transport system permease protein